MSNISGEDKELALKFGATHFRDGDLYKVGSTVKVLQYGDWVLCDNPFDIDGWLFELTEITIPSSQMNFE